jgi:hypothetical protein
MTNKTKIDIFKYFQQKKTENCAITDKSGQKRAKKTRESTFSRPEEQKLCERIKGGRCGFGHFFSIP